MDEMAKFAAAHTPSECVDMLTDIWRRGGFEALLNEFRRDPAGMTLCIALVVSTVLHKMYHTDEKPVFSMDDEFTSKCCTLATEMGVNRVSGPGSIIINILLTTLVEQLLKVIAEYLAEKS